MPGLYHRETWPKVDKAGSTQQHKGCPVEFQASSISIREPLENTISVSACQSPSGAVREDSHGRPEGQVPSLANQTESRITSLPTSAASLAMANSEAAQIVSNALTGDQQGTEDTAASSTTHTRSRSGHVTSTLGSSTGLRPNAADSMRSVGISGMPAHSSSIYSASTETQASSLHASHPESTPNVIQPLCTSDSPAITRHGSLHSSVVVQAKDKAGEGKAGRTGRTGRDSCALQPIQMHAAESEHSRGLQQLWNSMARTPLAVPSPQPVSSRLTEPSGPLSTSPTLGSQTEQSNSSPHLGGRGTSRPLAVSSSSCGSAVAGTCAAGPLLPHMGDADAALACEVDADTPVR